MERDRRQHRQRSSSRHDGTTRSSRHRSGSSSGENRSRRSDRRHQHSSSSSSRRREANDRRHGREDDVDDNYRRQHRKREEDDERRYRDERRRDDSRRDDGRRHRSNHRSNKNNNNNRHERKPQRTESKPSSRSSQRLRTAVPLEDAFEEFDPHKQLQPAVTEEPHVDPFTEWNAHDRSSSHNSDSENSGQSHDSGFISVTSLSNVSMEDWAKHGSPIKHPESPDKMNHFDKNPYQMTLSKSPESSVFTGQSYSAAETTIQCFPLEGNDTEADGDQDQSTNSNLSFFDDEEQIDVTASDADFMSYRDESNTSSATKTDLMMDSELISTQSAYNDDQDVFTNSNEHESDRSGSCDDTIEEERDRLANGNATGSERSKLKRVQGSFFDSSSKSGRSRESDKSASRQDCQNDASESSGSFDFLGGATGDDSSKPNSHKSDDDERSKAKEAQSQRLHAFDNGASKSSHLSVRSPQSYDTDNIFDGVFGDTNAFVNTAEVESTKASSADIDSPGILPKPSGEFVNNVEDDSDSEVVFGASNIKDTAKPTSDESSSYASSRRSIQFGDFEASAQTFRRNGSKEQRNENEEQAPKHCSNDKTKEKLPDSLKKRYLLTIAALAVLVLVLAIALGFVMMNQPNDDTKQATTTQSGPNQPTSPPLTPDATEDPMATLPPLSTSNTTTPPMQNVSSPGSALSPSDNTTDSPMNFTGLEHLSRPFAGVVTTRFAKFEDGKCTSDDLDIMPSIENQCACQNSLLDIADDVMELYRQLRVKINQLVYGGSLRAALRSCTAVNQALFWLSSGNTRDAGDLYQRFLLALLYFETNGTNWSDNYLWLSDQNECSWCVAGDHQQCTHQYCRYGIQCDQAFLVEGIALDSNGLQGTVPPQIGAMESLQNLNLANNDISGNLPSELFLLPHLKSIVLHDNALGGPLPQPQSNTSGIEVLSLENNLLTGGIPNEIASLTSLVELGLSSNTIGGRLPAGLGQLSKLIALKLDNIGLTGLLSKELGSLTALQQLLLSNNLLIGAVPEEFGALTDLRDFRASGTRLSGKFPAALTSLTSLERLELQESNFRQSLPAEIGNLKYLSILLLNQNSFSGPIPEEIGQLVGLTQLSLNDCSLSGPIPSALGSLTNLERLHLENTALTGSAPTEVCLLRNMNLVFFTVDCETVTCDPNTCCTCS